MLDRIKNELLDADATACLPKNLTDEWLDCLSSSSDKVMETSYGSAAESTAVISIILRLLSAKAPQRVPPLDEIEVVYEKFSEYTRTYRTELTLEKIHRTTDLTYN